MIEQMRHSGLDALGDVPWGTHFCQLYQTPQDLLDVLVAYFRQGLLDNEFCMWVTSEPLEVEEARLALGRVVPDLDDRIRGGQIEFLDYRAWYLAGGRFDADRVLQGWIEKERAALARGYEGVRATGNLSWLNNGYWKAFTDYEAVVNNVLGSCDMLALCTYPLDKCQGVEMLDVLRIHPLTLVRKEGKWEVIQSPQHRKMEESLHEYRNLLTSVIEGTNVGTWRWNVQSGEAAFSQRWAAIVGYTMEELAPISIQTWLRLAHPEDLPESEAALQKHFAGTLTHYDVECRMRHKSGSWVWVHDRGKVNEWTSDGKPLVMTGTHSDITERKQIEQALCESAANFRTFFESMTDMIMVGTPDGRILFTNAAVTRTLGYSAEELAVMRILDLHPAEHLREAEDIFAAMFRGERESCPLPMAHKDGGLVPVETRIWFGRWNGEDCIFGISKNLTTEMESQQRFERLFRHSPIPMALSILPERRFFDANDAFLKLLGYSKGEIVGKTTEDIGLFVAPARQAAVAEQLHANGRITDVELQVRRKDGMSLDGLFSGEIISSQGRQYFLTAMVDITERKRAEENQHRMQSHLAHVARLSQVGAMAAEITHELGQPLFAILNYAKAGRNFLAHEAPLDVARLSECVDKIAELATSAGSIGMRLRSFARRAEQECSACDVHDIIREAIALVTFEAHRNKVRVEIESSPRSATVWANRVEIQQVLVNLLANAFDAMDQTPLAMRCVVVRTVVDDDAVEVLVSDHGAGLPPGDELRIFDAFVTTKPKGLGMGLAISSTIIENYGGKIWASANSTGGASFHFQLPLHRKRARTPIGQ